jgi:hypothetical protein
VGTEIGLTSPVVNKVWMARPEWAIAIESYSELDTTKRNRAEKDLQQELEDAYPSTSLTGRQIRRCRGWLAGPFALGEA